VPSRPATVRLCRALAVLMLLVLVTHWRMVEILVRQLPVDPFGTLSLLALAFTVLLVGSIAGLFLVRPWAFACVYLMIPASTVLLGISFVPFLPRFFPAPARSVGLIAANTLVLAATVLAHVGYRRAGGRRAGERPA
jgi:hypothetical protein